jgi:hypothetical protein
MAQFLHPVVLASGDASTHRQWVRLRLCHCGSTVALVIGPSCSTTFLFLSSNIGMVRRRKQIIVMYEWYTICTGLYLIFEQGKVLCTELKQTLWYHYQIIHHGLSLN